MVSMRLRLAVCTLVLLEVLGYVAGKCSVPPPRDPGMLEQVPAGSEFDEGTEVMYVCGIGYHMASGNGRSTCIVLNGNYVWSAPTMMCSPTSCPEPERLNHGRVIGTEYSFGKSVNFECNEGYIMYLADDDTPVHRGEEPERECNAQGEWTGATPVCKPVQCPPPDRSIARGQVDVPSLDFMSVVTYSCNPGYQIKGNSQIRCLPTGAWSGTAPECIEIQCLEPDEKEFQTKYPGVTAHLTIGVEPGHTAHFECTDDKEMKVTSTCRNTGHMGEWDPPPPQCVVASVSTGADENTTPEPTYPVTTDGIDVTASHTPSAEDPPSDEGLPTWVVALLVVCPVALVLGGVVAYLWKRSKRQHQSGPQFMEM